jgi:hypothetical protein
VEKQLASPPKIVERKASQLPENEKKDSHRESQVDLPMSPESGISKQFRKCKNTCSEPITDIPEEKLESQASTSPTKEAEA